MMIHGYQYRGLDSMGSVCLALAMEPGRVRPPKRDYKQTDEFRLILHIVGNPISKLELLNSLL